VRLSGKKATDAFGTKFVSKVDCRGPDSLVVGKNWSPQLAPQREPRAVCLAEEGACILRAETRCPVWKANSTGGAEPEKSLHVMTPAAGSDSSKSGQRPPFTCRVAARPLALGCIGEIASTSRMRPRQRPHWQPHPLSTRVPFRGVFSPRQSAFQECQVPGLPLVINVDPNPAPRLDHHADRQLSSRIAGLPSWN